MRPGPRFILLIALLALFGCRTRSYGTFGILAPDYADAAVEILAAGVEARHCVNAFSVLYFGGSPPEYGKAVARALAKVPDANVLKDAHFAYQDQLFWLCARVQGDAGRFQ